MIFAEDTRPTYDINGFRNQFVLFANHVIENADRGSGNTSATFDKSQTAIGIDTLYGTQTRRFFYYGEVPANGVPDAYKDKDRGLPVYRPGKVGNFTRRWANDPNSIFDNLDGSFTYDDNGTNDLHFRNLHLDQSKLSQIGVALTRIVFKFLSFFNTIASFILCLLIDLSDFRIDDLMNAIGLDELQKQMTNVLIRDESGNWSPVAILAFAGFLFGVVGMIWKFVTDGGASLMALAQELVIFVFAGILMFMSINGNFDTIRNSANELSKTLLTSLATGGGDDGEGTLFVYTSDDKTKDFNMTKKSIVSKIFIDTMVRSQFGVSPSDLDMWNDDIASVSQDNWGITTSQAKQLVRNLTKDGREDFFAVYTGKNTSNKKQPNLGYYAYAATSNVYTHDPFTSINENGTIKFRGGDPESDLYIIDWLSGVDALTGGSAKAQQIIDHMYNPEFDMGLMFMTIIVTVSIQFAVGVCVLYSLYGAILFNAGILALPIISLMLLVPNLREYAKQLATTVLVALIKMVAGSALVTIILIAASTMCEAGILGYCVCILTMIILGISAPKLLAALNSVVGKNQIELARQADQGFNNFAYKIGGARGVASASAARARIAEQIANQRQKAQAPAANEDYRSNFDAMEDKLTNFNGGSGKQGSGTGETDEGFHYEFDRNHAKEARNELENIKDLGTMAMKDLDRKSNYDIIQEEVEAGNLKIDDKSKERLDRAHERLTQEQAKQYERTQKYMSYLDAKDKLMKRLPMRVAHNLMSHTMMGSMLTLAHEKYGQKVEDFVFKQGNHKPLSLKAAESNMRSVEHSTFGVRTNNALNSKDQQLQSLERITSEVRDERKEEITSRVHTRMKDTINKYTIKVRDKDGKPMSRSSNFSNNFIEWSGKYIEAITANTARKEQDYNYTGEVVNQIKGTIAGDEKLLNEKNETNE